MSQVKSKQRTHNSESDAIERTSRASSKGKVKPDSKKVKSSDQSDQPSITSFTSQAPSTSLDTIITQLKELSDQQQRISVKLDTCMTENYFKEYLDNVKTEIIKSFEEKLEKMAGKIFEIERKQNKLIEENIELEKENRAMHEKIKAIDFTANLALTRTNNLEQYTRKDSIRIFGIVDKKRDETAQETIVQTLQVLAKIDMNVTKSDISIAHRLGQFSEDKPRPVIVKFIARTHKIEAIAKRRKLKGTRTVITEDLTKDNYIFFCKVKAHSNVDVAWTRDGITYAKLLSNGRVVKVLTINDLS